MGIQDLELDLNQLSDHILVVSNSDETTNHVTELLKKRSYRYSHAIDTEAASKLALKDLIDLIILDQASMIHSISEVLASVQSDPGLKRAPLIVLHPTPEKLSEEGVLTKDIIFLKTPFQAGELLVKVATKLRLRKIDAEQSSFETQIAAQNAQLRDLTAWFARELKEAQSIQQSLLPKSLPEDPACEFAAKYVPLEAVGGDLYDVWEIRDRVYGIIIGDVSGHGLPAAFIGAMTKMALSYAGKESPDKMFAEMNNGLAKHMPDGRFVTAMAVIYEAETGRLLVARGGHPPGFLWRAEKKEVEQLKPAGMPLGCLPDQTFELAETILAPGDKVLFVTDALTETTDMNGAVIGIEGCQERFAEFADGCSISLCLEEMFTDLLAFAGGRALKDDVTLVGLQRLLVS